MTEEEEDESLDITTETKLDYAVIHLRGNCDTYYSTHLLQQVEAAVKAGAKNLAVNTQDVDYVSRNFLGAFIKASKDLKKVGGKLAIICPSQACCDVMDEVDFRKWVPVCGSEEEAAVLFDH